MASNTAIISTNECSRVCTETLQYYQDAGVELADDELLDALKDCANICEAAADAMDRESEMHHKICAVCVDICEHCAEICENMPSPDEQLMKAEQACLDCAASCRDMTSFTDRIT